MSRTKGHPEGRRRDTEQREPDERQAGQPEADQEAQNWAQETGYQPSVNQRRHEPLPASHHAGRLQEAVIRNEEHADTHVQAAPSPRVQRRD
jgi:hypothetical protein